MSVKPKLMFFFILAFAVVLGAGYFGLSRYVKGKEFVRQLQEQARVQEEQRLNSQKNNNGDRSAFGTTDASSLPALTVSFMNKIWFSDFDDFITKKSLKWDWKDWDYRKDFIMADVVESFPDQKQLSLNIILPSDRSFSRRVVQEPYVVDARCTPENSVLLASDMSVKGSVEDFFARAKGSGYRLYTKCLSDGCKEVGYGCVLVETQ